MQHDSGRRRCLSGAVALTGSALALRLAPSALAQPARLETVSLSQRTIAVIGPDAVSLATQSGDGVILIGGGHERWSDDLLGVVAEAFGGMPISALFNTHWHREQTGANLRLGERGVPILAHENTRLWLGTEVWVRWSDQRFPPLPAAARPSTGFDGSGSIRLGGRNVEYIYQRNAHTDGDIGVFLPDENILVTGGHVASDSWPIIDWWTGGWIGGMLDGFDLLVETGNPDTVIVPASGPIMSYAELTAQHEMYLTIFDRLHEMLRNARSTAEVLAARPTAEFDRQMGDPELFLTLAFQSMWRHLRDAHDTRMQNIP
ncbi:MAG TPA: MBL fold metallo-hydrolase [Gammaproteobacteria bacterium]|nr:MBL fold metallo-hydrolase [Gammaproteobacteria bacterium]